MNRLILPLILTLIGARCAFAGPLPNSYTEYSVAISAGPSQGSGFIFQASNSIYVVTARHVLFNVTQSPTNWPLWGPVGTCTGHIGTNTCVMTLDLAQLAAAGEVRYSPNHDVAIIRFEELCPTNKNLARLLPGTSFQSTYTTFSEASESVCEKFDTTEVGTETFIFGFPSSIGLAEMKQIDFDLPLLRKGIVAGKNAGRHVYILDCPAYQGNSGGPVIGKIQDGFSFRFPLLGIVTEMVPYSETWQNERLGYVNHNIMNSGYSIAEPIDVALAMFWK